VLFEGPAEASSSLAPEKLHLPLWCVLVAIDGS
jgi:hypothetical protein